MIKITDILQLTDKQKLALKHIGKGKIIFYGGARGGGKSYLSHVAANLFCYKIPELRCIIIRETYPELEDVFISHQEERFPPNLFKYKYQSRSNICEFQNGSRIMFKPLDSAKAARKIMGSQFQLMIIDEANNYDEQTLRKLLGSVRNTNPNINFKSTVLMTGNPGGQSDFYFKTRFVNPDYKYWDKGELKYKDNYVFIKAMVYDNPYIEQQYIDMLDTLPEDLRQAWLYGNWTTFEGQFFSEFNHEHHVIAPFPIPKDWHKVIGFDIGYTKKHPAVALCIAQNPITNELFVFDEYVGIGSTEEYIETIKEIINTYNINIVYADPSMWNDTKKDKHTDESPAFMFLKAGIPIVQANNKRVNGWRIIKQWLHWTEKRSSKLKIFDNCSYLIQTLPLNKYNTSSLVNKEDCDTNGPDDAIDALRYAIVTGFGYPLGKGNEIQITEETNDFKNFIALYNEEIVKENNNDDEEEKIYKRYINADGYYSNYAMY